MIIIGITGTIGAGKGTIVDYLMQKCGFRHYSVRQYLLDVIQKAGLEPIRLHDLRHTFATLALQNGVDIRTVSGMLGHADPGFTLRTYTHTADPQQVRAANTIGQLMAASM